MAALPSDPRLPRSNSRYYELGAQRLWRVTTLLGAINKPALVPWAASMERAACIEVAQALQFGDHDGLTPGNFAERFAALIGPAKAHQKATQEAQDIGTQAHRRLEWVVRGRIGPEPECSAPAIMASEHGVRWLKQVDFVLLHAEQTVWSEIHRYAGTMDLHGEATLPGLGRCTVIADWKTGKAVYPEARLQMAAYRQALIEMGHAARPMHAVVLRLPKVATDPDFEAVILHDAELQTLFLKFLAAAQLFEFIEEQDQAWRSKRKAA